MQTRGRNTLVIEQHDEQLVDNQNNSVDQAHDGESNELNSSVGGTEVQPTDELGNTIFSLYCCKI
ncbi:hypothetical protein R3W88_008466 [Solanum pinnatisectum]|uniref:Uncharacterized protein n=1 Tax=Solanum pinnatisectum TaxID=50273 RepID=A0AAV9MB14_9SOLN|nr:hypothetical protein R3W88_008466 [Solanum pinnatisectum]